MDSNELATVDSSSWMFDREGTLHAPLRPLRLLDAFDAQLTRRADGTGHAVVEPRSGQVLGRGDTPQQAGASALRTARLLGRRRLRAALDSGAPIAVAQAPNAALAEPAADNTVPGDWQRLYDQAVRKGSDWETLHHNGGVIDKTRAAKEYGHLQDELRSAIVDPNTPDEARLPLATAGYRLYAGASVAGVNDPGHIPYSALKAATGAMAFSGGGAVGPRIGAVPQGRGLLSPGTGNRTAIAIGGPSDRELTSPSARQPQFPALPGVGRTGRKGIGVTNPEIGKLKPPLPPPGLTRSELGKNVFEWGRGPADALKRANTIGAVDLEKMRRSGLTKEMCEHWRDVYANDFRRNSNNITAKNRVLLMQKILDLWQE